MTIERINGLSKEAFTDTFGGIYEHSPWVAERTWNNRPFLSLEDLANKMNAVVEAASEDEKLALLRAHPELGTRMKVSASSATEQAGAGLDQLYSVLQPLNDAYRQKFGFPFIYAVKGSGKDDILVALMVRSDSDRETEFKQALWEVSRIARFRLEAMK
jgi:2-oxo-4-hydroxy-4-carboxy-5-ureidoimidazoline decarboxylase